MAYILHIDTSAESGLTALSKDGEILAQKINEEVRNHASTINKDIDFVLSASGIALKDVDAITVCSGPGSYTGLRIGVSTAKGICYALNKPLMMDSKLLLIAYDVWNDLNEEWEPDNKINQYYAILPAREGEYFVSGYDKNFTENLAPTHMLKTDALQLEFTSETMVIGELDEEMTQKAEQNNTEVYTTFKSHQANAESWAKYAYQQYKCKAFVNLANSEPNYLKKVYTHKPKSSK